MKTSFYIALVCLLAVGCQPSPEYSEAVLVKQHQQTQQFVDSAVNSIIYIKDPRTSICYAYYWGGLAIRYRRQSFLTTVPENSIPTNLLWTANIYK